VHLIYLEVPYTQLLSQNRNREYSVPNDVIHRMINKLEIPDYSEAHTVDFVVGN
ncbi:MAG: poly(A) polymerase, partial [Neisseria sicca]|nr:poly(A) polymerase [Neisseria sicca]